MGGGKGVRQTARAHTVARVQSSFECHIILDP